MLSSYCCMTKIIITMGIKQEFGRFLRCCLLFVRVEPNLTKLDAIVIRIPQYKFHFCCSKWLRKFIFDRVPTLTQPFRAEVTYFCPTIVFKIVDKYLLWITFYFIVCRFKCNSSNADFPSVWELYLYPRLYAKAKPFIPMISPRHEKILAYFFVTFMAMLCAYISKTHVIASMRIKQVFFSFFRITL